MFNVSRYAILQLLAVVVLCYLLTAIYIKKHTVLLPDRIIYKKPFMIWSNDYHIGPIRDLKALLQPLGVEFIDKSLSGHCHLTDTCHHNLTIINKANAMGLDEGGVLVNEFYKAYRNDPEMKSVDSFVCFHPSAMCELFMPFNKPIFVIASTRYELGRFTPHRWEKWNENLIQISKDDRNVVAGNNLYDAKYIEYFTGVEAKVLSSFCGYISDSYAGTRPGFILAPLHREGFETIFLHAFESACEERNCTVNMFYLRDKYPHYEYRDLCAHKGIVYVPYQVSVMSLFEQYRMNIPLFFPSKSLLGDWQHRYMIMNERTWDGVFGKKPKGSNMKAHPNQKDVPDPNSETNRTAIDYWLNYADFYMFPYITYFDSHRDLVTKMESANLHQISRNMAKYNSAFKKRLLTQWKAILKRAGKTD